MRRCWGLWSTRSPTPSPEDGGTGSKTLSDSETAPTDLFELSMLGENGDPFDMKPRDVRGLTSGISKPIDCSAE